MATQFPQGMNLVYRLDGGGAEGNLVFKMRAPKELGWARRLELWLARRLGRWERVLDLHVANVGDFVLAEWGTGGPAAIAQMVIQQYDWQKRNPDAPETDGPYGAKQEA